MLSRTRKMSDRAANLRAQGFTYARIAKRLSISPGWAFRLAQIDREHRSGEATERLLRAGAFLSNVAFNLSQGVNLLPPETRARLNELRLEWDAARAALGECDR